MIVSSRRPCMRGDAANSQSTPKSCSSRPWSSAPGGTNVESETGRATSGPRHSSSASSASGERRMAASALGGGAPLVRLRHGAADWLACGLPFKSILGDGKSQKHETAQPFRPLR